MRQIPPRRAGILLPIFSLPSPYGIGSLGESAYKFIRFLRDAGQKIWQVLPLGGTGFGDSPYQSFSAFAGNPYFIDLDMLMQEGLLSREDLSEVKPPIPEDRVSYQWLWNTRMKILRHAFHNINSLESLPGFNSFAEEHSYWLDDYVLFTVLKQHFAQLPWFEWKLDIRKREAAAMNHYAKLLKEEINFQKFVQFKFFEQWQKLKKYAETYGILIMGDCPLYPAMNSADVWSHQEFFQLDKEGYPLAVAGVPPDCFSEDGQLWGNPLYNWEVLADDGYTWWIHRIEESAKLYNILRIDHFIGLVKYYSIAADENTARNGLWRDAPGVKLLELIERSAGDTEIVAEDLGVPFAEVQQVLDRCGYPGMKVLQFAFDGNPVNPHLPMYNFRNQFVYGGTHDNDTLIGYFTSHIHEHEFARIFLGIPTDGTITEIVDGIIRAGYSSVARTVIFQMQDYLKLDSTARINMPSTVGGNWEWRLLPEQIVQHELAEHIRQLTEIYARNGCYYN